MSQLVSDATASVADAVAGRFRESGYEVVGSPAVENWPESCGVVRYIADTRRSPTPVATIEFLIRALVLVSDQLTPDDFHEIFRASATHVSHELEGESGAEIGKAALPIVVCNAVSSEIVRMARKNWRHPYPYVFVSPAVVDIESRTVHYASGIGSGLLLRVPFSRIIKRATTDIFI